METSGLAGQIHVNTRNSDLSLRKHEDHLVLWGKNEFWELTV